MNTIEESGKIPASIKKKVRSSNLELLRILAMFTIVAHHSVVNSGIEEWFSFSEITPNMVFLQCAYYVYMAFLAVGRCYDWYGDRCIYCMQYTRLSSHLFHGKAAFQMV